jgi:putative sterol carrier protein
MRTGSRPPFGAANAGRVDRQSGRADNRVVSFALFIPEAVVAHAFPSEAWLKALVEILNKDTHYAETARNWEGDMVCVVESDEDEAPPLAVMYLDLWHGQCRAARSLDPVAEPLPSAKFVLRAPRRHFLKVVLGELDPMQAMMTRRLRVEGNMAYMLRNVPTVLDFVRCCRLVAVEG